jgi:hypothetical protein
MTQLRVLFFCWALGGLMIIPPQLAMKLPTLLKRFGVEGYPLGAAMVAALLLLAYWPFHSRDIIRAIVWSEHPEMKRLRSALRGPSNRNSDDDTPIH